MWPWQGSKEIALLTWSSDIFQPFIYPNLKENTYH